MILPNRTCSDCKHIWRESCEVADYWLEISEVLPDQMEYWPIMLANSVCDDGYEPNFTGAVKDLRDAIIAPLIPIADRLERWLEERGGN